MPELDQVTKNLGKNDFEITYTQGRELCYHYCRNQDFANKPVLTIINDEEFACTGCGAIFAFKEAA